MDINYNPILLSDIWIMCWLLISLRWENLNSFVNVLCLHIAFLHLYCRLWLWWMEEGKNLNLPAMYKWSWTCVNIWFFCSTITLTTSTNKLMLTMISWILAELKQYCRKTMLQLYIRDLVHLWQWDVIVHYVNISAFCGIIMYLCMCTPCVIDTKLKHIILMQCLTICSVHKKVILKPRFIITLLYINVSLT
jgi:hypothetical protein